MKVIILLSSIFYILGLKLSNKIDLIKSTPRIEKISIQKATPSKSEKTIEYSEAESLKAKTDTIKCGGSCTSEVLEYK
ncbi:hypothetical protein [Maribellus sediminis]|uniref:hypothetical protein n=1 Tax=Maribellus sediminis TaxID=2696285 RepID=UPI00142FF98B|nr:hypothetical protein [Maribellus sediminis]